MKTINIFLFIISFFVFSHFVFIVPVFAAENTAAGAASNPITPGSNSTASVKLSDPLNGATPQTLIGRVISAAMGIVGSLALAMFIYGGFLWMTAAGNSESVTKGKNVLIWASLGLIVIFTSYALVKFVFSTIGA